MEVTEFVDASKPQTSKKKQACIRHLRQDPLLPKLKKATSGEATEKEQQCDIAMVVFLMP
jgi:hypothetical protein